MENIKLIARNIKENNSKKSETNKELKADKAAEQMKKEQDKFNEMLHDGIGKQPTVDVNTQKVETEQVVLNTNNGQDKELE